MRRKGWLATRTASARTPKQWHTSRLVSFDWSSRATRPHLEERFPALSRTGYAMTSVATRRYNCVAWAANDENQWWWPDRRGGFWPPDVPRELTQEAFLQAFATLGDAPCNSSYLEPGREKVAIYLANGLPAHAARQLSDGAWTSNCGRSEDIRHPRDGLAGDVYGQPAVFLARSSQ